MGPTLLVWMLLLAAATLISEDLTSIAAGLLVAQGRIDLWPAVAACASGIFIGDVALFLAGRWLGRPWLARAPLNWLVSSRALEASSRWFERRGTAVIFLSRFWSGMRLPTYVVAGLLRTRWPKFIGLFAVAVAVWTPILVGAAAWLGDRWLVSLTGVQRSLWLLVPVAILLAWLLSTLRRVTTRRGRQRWLANWRRRRRWEFWPPWLFYLPVVAWVLWLGLRFRNLTLFTAANPSLPAGGFVGESKSDILDGLPADAVARHLRLRAQITPAAG